MPVEYLGICILADPCSLTDLRSGMLHIERRSTLFGEQIAFVLKKMTSMKSTKENTGTVFGR